MKKILIVEDEEPISNLIRIKLTAEDYRCTCAFDGRTAADLIEKEDFDLILLDIMLPEINGYDLMEYIKPLETPVIFLTARNAVWGVLLFFAFTLLIGWRFRSRNFYYAMDICEVLLLTAILKVSPLLELSVNDLIAMASVMLLNKVILPFLYIPSDSRPRIIPFVFLLLLELYVLVRLIHKRKYGYGAVIAYAVASCWMVLSLYRKCELLLYSYYFVGESEISFIRKELYILAVIFVISVFIFLAIRCIGIFVKKRL